MSHDERHDAQLTPEQLRLMNAYELLTGDAPQSAAVDELSEQEQLQLQEYVELSADIARVTTSVEVAPRVRDEIFAMAARRRVPAQGEQGDELVSEQPWWVAWLRPAPIAAFGLAAALLFAVSVQPPSVAPVDGGEDGNSPKPVDSMVAMQTRAQPAAPSLQVEADPQAEEAPLVQELQLAKAAPVASPSVPAQADKLEESASDPIVSALQPKGRVLPSSRRKRSKSRARPKRAIAAKPASLGPTKSRKIAAASARKVNSRVPADVKALQKLITEQIQAEAKGAGAVQDTAQTRAAPRARSRAKQPYKFEKMPLGEKGSKRATPGLRQATKVSAKPAVEQSLARLRQQVVRSKGLKAKRAALLRLLKRAKALKNIKMIRWASTELKAISASKTSKP